MIQYITLLPVLWIILHPAVGQLGNRGGDERCVKLRRQTRNHLLPKICNNQEFYDSNAAVFNGNKTNGLQRTLHKALTAMNAESTADLECVKSVQQYLCYYYFPLCNQQTGEIMPVCDDSCNLLFSNDNCLALMIVTSQKLSIHNTTAPDESCLSTHWPFVNASISDNCIEMPFSDVSTNNDIIDDGISRTNATTIDNGDIDNATTSNGAIDNTTDKDDINNSSAVVNEATSNEIIENDTVNNDTINNDTTINPTTGLSNGEQDRQPEKRRCVKLKRQPNLLHRSCNNGEFYDSDDSVLNGNRINNLLKAFDNIFNTLNTEYANNSECVKSVQQYLCYYYFLLCNKENGEIVPVCNNSCHLLFNNVDCFDLMRIASQELRIHNIIAPDETCSSTHRSFINQPQVSDNCKYIKVPLSDDIADSDNTNDSTNVNNDTSYTDTTDDDSNSTATMVGIVVAIVAALVMIIVIIMIMVLVVQRSKRKQKMPENFVNDEELKEERYIVDDAHEISHDETTALEIIKTSYSSEISQLLKYVEEKFSDVLLPEGVVTKLDLIGKGAFGIVSKGELKSSDNTIKAVAIKSIKSESIDGMKNLVAELAIMKKFHHSNVLPLLGVCIDYNDKDVLKIVMPFMTNGDLKNYLKNNRISPNNTDEYPEDLSEGILMRMCLDIAQGMEYLAEKRFVHRDLAARNCMVDEKLAIRVADFGLARDIYTTEYYRIQKHVMLPVKWMSLESLLDGYFDEKTDVWSYGVTCWEIFSLGRIPYPGVDNADVISFLKQGKRLAKPRLCPSATFDMIVTMWQEESSKRPSFAEIVQSLQKDSKEDSITSEELCIETDENRKNNYIDLLAQ